jgi:hypothetical protein
MTSASDIIKPGDVVAVLGFPEFQRALVAALGKGAFGFTLADWDHRPDVHFGDEITFPAHPGAAPIPMPADDAEREDSERIYVFAVGAQARNRESLCGMANVILDATSTTAARVVRTGGVALEGVGLTVRDGRVEVSRRSV